MGNTINVDIEVVYFWYDHLLLRKNGDAEKVTQAIENGDYDTFMMYYNKYNNKYNKDDLIFFPEYASIFYRDSWVGTIDITTPIGFSMITFSEYECG